jgi:hypothetical protein
MVAPRTTLKSSCRAPTRRGLRGVLARDANHDAIATRIGEDEGYAGMVDTLRAIGGQHPEAMWLVHAWWVDNDVE